MKKKTDQGQYIGLRPDVKLKFANSQGAKVFLEGKEIADIELDFESHPVFLALLPLLNEARTVGEIIASLKQRGIAESAVISCLDFLLQSGFAFQFARFQDSYQAANYAWRTSEPQEILDKIANAKVYLQGQENFCQLIANALTGAGVQSIKISPASVHSAWDNWAADADLIILFGETWEQVLAMNSWCVKNRKPLIVGWWQRFTVSFGPILVPGVTACQVCIHERQGNLNDPDFMSGDSQAGSFPMVLSAASLLAGLAVEFLSGASLTRSLTSIHEIDLRRGAFATYPALKNPRCPTCSRLKTWPEGAAIDA